MNPKISPTQKTFVREFLMLPDEFLEALPLSNYGTSLHALCWPIGELPRVLSATELRSAILKSQLRHILFARFPLDPSMEGKYQVHADHFGLVGIDTPTLHDDALFSGGISARFDALNPATRLIEDRPDTREFCEFLWAPMAAMLTTRRICWEDGKRASGVCASMEAINLYLRGSEWRRGIQPEVRYELCDDSK